MTRPTHWLSACAAAAILAIGVTACGGSDDKSAVKDRVQTTFSGFANKDSGKICDSLSDAYKKRISAQRIGKRKLSCEKSIGLVLTLAGNALKDVGDTKVGDVTINGSKAIANVSYKSGKKSKIALVKQGGDWRVDNFSLQR